MEYIRAEHVRDDIIAIRPVYSDEGDVSELITRSGEVFTDRRQLRSVLKGLLRSYGLDIEYQRRFIKETLRRQAVTPFFLSEERVFIPLKMRRPSVPGDKVYGYLDVGSLRKIPPEGEGKSRCLLLLANGVRLEVLSGKTTVLKAQDSGNKLRAILNDKKRPGEKEKSRGLAKLSLKIGQDLGGIIEQIDRIEWGINYVREEVSRRG